MVKGPESSNMENRAISTEGIYVWCCVWMITVW